MKRFVQAIIKRIFCRDKQFVLYDQPPRNPKRRVVSRHRWWRWLFGKEHKETQRFK